MDKRIFDRKHQHLNIDAQELDRKYKAYLQEQEDMEQMCKAQDYLRRCATAGVGSAPSPLSPPPPPPPRSEYTILQYRTDQGAYVSWDENGFGYDSALPNFSYTLDLVGTIPAANPPTPAALTAVQIGNVITGIGNLAFTNCGGLTSVTFATISAVTSIGNNAFSNCASLTSIAIPTSVTSIANNAFSSSGLTTVTIANGQLGIASPASGVSFFGVIVNTITP